MIYYAIKLIFFFWRYVCHDKKQNFAKNIFDMKKKKILFRT